LDEPPAVSVVALLRPSTAFVAEEVAGAIKFEKDGRMASPPDEPPTVLVVSVVVGGGIIASAPAPTIVADAVEGAINV
jgi:hypothetical protein